MANDWTPMRNDLADDPAVVSMAMALNMDPDLVVGKLLRVWGWAGAHTTTGKCVGVSKAHVDRAARCEKFSDAMDLAGWLKVDAEGNVTFPRWGKWNGKATKKRLQTAIRMARMRERNKRNAGVTVTPLQNRTEQAENRREEKAAAKQGGDSLGVLPALPATAMEALVAVNVGEPMRSRLAAVTNPTEVYEILASIRPGRKNPVGVLVGELCKRHGITMRGEKNGHVGRDLRAANDEFLKLRRLRGNVTAPPGGSSGSRSRRTNEKDNDGEEA